MDTLILQTYFFIVKIIIIGVTKAMFRLKWQHCLKRVCGYPSRHGMTVAYYHQHCNCCKNKIKLALCLSAETCSARFTLSSVPHSQFNKPTTLKKARNDATCCARFSAKTVPIIDFYKRRITTI